MRYAGALVFAGSWLVASIGVLRILRDVPLTFEWDEWTLLAGMPAGPGWLLQEHIDSVFPLGRGLFWLETSAFGLDYRAYVLVNLVLLFAASILVFRLLAGLCGSLPAGVFAALYVLAHGQHYNVIWAMQGAWFLAILFAAILMFRVADRVRPLGSAGNIVLIFLVWLSLSSTVVAVPGLVTCTRVLSRVRDRAPFRRSEVLGFVFVTVLCVELAVAGRWIAEGFPPPHEGARASHIATSSRLSKPATVVADAVVAHVFYTTSPLIPGALTMYEQRPAWGTFAVWLGAGPARAVLVLGVVLAATIVALWRLAAGGERYRPISLWIVSAAVILWPLLTATATARSVFFGPPLSPRYDSWLVFGSLLAAAALAIDRLASIQCFEKPAPERARTARLVRSGCIFAIAVHVAWLAAGFQASVSATAAPRGLNAREWERLRGRCRTDFTRRELSIPQSLQPQLTAQEYCSIISRLEGTVQLE